MAQQQTLQLPRTSNRAGSPMRHNHTPAIVAPAVVSMWRRRQAEGTDGVQIRDFTPADLVPAARLLALRHQNARLTLPELPADLQSARPWAIKLGRLFSRGQGVVATSGGAVVGFVVSAATEREGTRQQAEGSVPAEAHAVASRVDAGEVYAELHAALAGRWTRERASANNVSAIDINAGHYLFGNSSDPNCDGGTERRNY